MGLSTYQEKRNFRQTAEPRGKTKSSGKDLIFVIQKHNASRLHYDFRLELSGVLLSWAVPKGPSMNPSERHLAVQVEDHPYDYKDFEGVIPAGNYGAGEVIVWDKGTYHWNESSSPKESAAAMHKGIAKGHLEIVLNGKKLKGLFHLVRLKNTEWLLMKAKDEFATTKDVLKDEKSVITGKTLKDYGAVKKTAAKKTTAKKASVKKTIAKKAVESTAAKKVSASGKVAVKKKAVKKSAKAASKKKVKKATLPAERIEPMYAKLQENLPAGDNYIFELKYDGYRAIAATGSGEDADLYSRNKLSLLEKFSVLKEDLEAIPFPVVLDGEIVAEDEEGRSRFQLLQQYLKIPRGTIRYYVFDLLFLNGEDLRELPLTDRRKLLEALFKHIKSDKIRIVETRTAVTPEFIADLKVKGYEGVIAKKADAPYLSSLRTDAWIKIKNLATQEAVIIGYTPPGGSRAFFGSLLLATSVNGKLKYIGKCGTGFSDSTLRDIYKRMQRYIVKKPAVAVPKTDAAGATFLSPKLICEVRFTEFTDEGIMRHPAFRGLREDKSIKDINNEYPIPMKGDEKEPAEMKAKKTISGKTAAKKSAKVKTASRKTVSRKSAVKKSGSKKVAEIVVSNPDKIYWPKLKITKGMLVDYYREVSDLMMPFILNRLHSLNRHPNGITGSSFYQKNMNRESLPEGLETHTLKSGSGRDVHYFLCNSREALIYMANLGCIEINPWNNTVDSPDHPDWMIIDLDPEKIAFSEVVKTALEVRRLFEQLEIESYIKTSGSTGLHIYVPMGKKYTYDEVRMFGEVIANTVHRRIPEITSVLRSPAKRQKKIYLDFLQNRRGQTLAAPFSVRPKPAVSVSMPLDWSEVNKKLSPEDFTMLNMMKRAEKAFEIWKPVLGKAVPLKKILQRLSDLE
jgi:bifunctional non-homologous end joining protein LigD